MLSSFAPLPLFCADLHGTMPGRLLRFDLDAVTTSLNAPSYMEESYVKGIIEEKQARFTCLYKALFELAACRLAGWPWLLSGCLSSVPACKPTNGRPTSFGSMLALAQHCPRCHFFIELSCRD